MTLWAVPLWLRHRHSSSHRCLQIVSTTARNTMSCSGQPTSVTLRAQIEVEGLAGQSGSMGWDPNSERSVLQENDPTEFQDLREQTQLLDRATSDLVDKPDPNLDDFPEFQPRGDGLWLGIVQLAKTEGMALWSDDLAVRRLARSLGVNAFGTGVSSS